jgi:hypothetical protein
MTYFSLFDEEQDFPPTIGENSVTDLSSRLLYITFRRRRCAHTALLAESDDSYFKTNEFLGRLTWTEATKFVENISADIRSTIGSAGTITSYSNYQQCLVIVSPLSGRQI